MNKGFIIKDLTTTWTCDIIYSLNIFNMALAKQVQESLKEAESSLRNALAFAARGERPVVCNQIAKLINEIDQIQSFDGILDKIEQHIENGTLGSDQC